MDTVNLEQLHRTVSDLIRRVDFSSLWEGFHPIPFALYTQDRCCLDGRTMEKPSDFLGNTAREYQGQWIAIWNIAGPVEPVILASKIVHEMFHGFQHLCGESRFPNELHALYSYRYLDENLSVKLRENRLLADLSECFSREKLEHFLALRKFRAHRFPEEFRYESMAEQIEGCANYVELMVLRQLCPEQFRRKLEGMVRSITEPEALLPIRIPCYDIGALLLYVLKTNAIPFCTGFTDTTFSEVLILGLEEAADPCSGEMEAHIHAYFTRAEQLVQRALERNQVVEDREIPLLGVNVYDAVRWQKYIISTYFVMYGDPNAPTVLQGDFVIETEREGILSRIYRL